MPKLIKVTVTATITVTADFDQTRTSLQEAFDVCKSELRPHGDINDIRCIVEEDYKQGNAYVQTSTGKIQ